MNFKLLPWDIIVVLSFICYFGAGIATKLVLVNIQTLTAAAVELESNPMARQIVDVGFYFQMVQVLEVAFLGGIYWLIRKKYVNNPTEGNYQIISFYSIFLLIAFVNNLFNDLPVLINVLRGV